MGRAPKHGINWTFDSLTPTLSTFTIKANFAISAAARDLAKEIEQYMKVHAPWTDRTGDARRNLVAFVNVNKGSFHTEIVLSHGVTYGYWLEVIQNGRYSIIVPTIEHYDGVNTWHHFNGVMEAATLGRISG